MICQCGTPMVLTERWTPETCCGPAVELKVVCPRCHSHRLGRGEAIKDQPESLPMPPGFARHKGNPDKPDKPDTRIPCRGGPMFIKSNKPVRLKTETGKTLLVRPHQVIEVSDAIGRKLVGQAPDQIRQVRAKR